MTPVLYTNMRTIILYLQHFENNKLKMNHKLHHQNFQYREKSDVFIQILKNLIWYVLQMKSFFSILWPAACLYVMQYSL